MAILDNSLKVQNLSNFHQFTLYKRPTNIGVFPTYGAWDSKSTIKSMAQIKYGDSIVNMSIDQNQKGKDDVDRVHFRKLYFEKQYMDEMLKMKNIMKKSNK
ncbi:UNKNOWN [Stylonychia lemnae]|uniref:Uncharacterized protein n=1 Tax=Stylonychia lemnae TaxID=5949 RepID=A0A078B289_STYLE|nr:UNKNOWN [Stylonychia lemnae]|eukprot:CDW88599.1 UNKNOWN [Stylonychia lemnae]